MRIAAFLNHPIFKEGKDIFTNQPNDLDFFLTLSDKIEKLILCLPAGYGTQGKVKLSLPENVSILPVPYYFGTFDFIRKLKTILALMKLSFAQSIKKCDMVGIAVPTTIGFIVAPLVRYLYSKPIFFIVRVDRRQLPKHEFNNYPIKKHITQAVFSVYDFFVRQMLKTKKVIMFTFGEALMEDYANKIGRNSVFALHPAIPTELISMHNSMISEVENILYVGRLAKEKGINNLLKAFAEIKKKPEIVEDSLTLNIVGLGSEEKYLKAKVNQLKISTSVKFHGFIPPGTNLWRLYDQSQIFVLPSYTESLARVLYEAMARGVAVITTNVGGIPFKVKDGENGLLVRPGDVKGLKNAILRLIQDRELRSLLVTKGYKTVLEVTFEKQGKIMVDILRHRFYRFLNEED